MDQDISQRELEVLRVKKRCAFRLCNVSRYLLLPPNSLLFCFPVFEVLGDLLLSYTTEIMEIRADNPRLHVLIIPGNPGGFLSICVCMCLTDSILRVLIWVGGYCRWCSIFQRLCGGSI